MIGLNPLALPFLPRPPTSPESATHSQPHGTFWECTDGSSPMTRSGAASSADLPQPKKEEEHGVDFAFLMQDRRELIIFVLKDEKLTYKNFDAHSFRTDLSRASAQDLTAPELAGVTAVRVVLAYNKSEDEEGVEVESTAEGQAAEPVGEKGKECPALPGRCARSAGQHLAVLQGLLRGLRSGRHRLAAIGF